MNTVFQKNEMRTFPTKEEFLEDKKLNDIIYGFFQTHSYLTPDKKRYCWKQEVTAGKILKYFEDLEKENSDNISCGDIPKERTIRDMAKLFSKCGILSEGEIDKKKVYFLPDLKGGEYVFIKTETLRFLVNTATSNVIKVYAFLKKKQKEHIDFNFKDSYRFSKAKLLEVIGYCGNGSHGDALKKVDDILNCLINNGLIKVHQEWFQTTNKNVTQYYVLDDVSEDYIKTIKSKAKEDTSVCAFPVIENKPEPEPKKPIIVSIDDFIF